MLVVSNVISKLDGGKVCAIVSLITKRSKPTLCVHICFGESTIQLLLYQYSKLFLKLYYLPKVHPFYMRSIVVAVIVIERTELHPFVPSPILPRNFNEYLKHYFHEVQLDYRTLYLIKVDGSIQTICLLLLFIYFLLVLVL